MPSPAVVDNHRMIDHIEVPVVIAVGPCTTAVELSAWSREQLTCEAVGITMVVTAIVGTGIVVLVGVAVDYLIITAIGVSWVELWRSANGERLCFLNLPVLEHTYLQACIVVPAEDTTLNDVIRAFHLHAVVLSVLQHQAVESPVVGQVVDIDTTSHLEC